MTWRSTSSSNVTPRSRGGVQVATPAPSGFIGRYQLLEKIGEGGMGSLFLARDPAIDRLVAIKLLRRGLDTEALRERFAREARAAGRLRHPNIVTIFDVGEHEGDPFIAMEFLAGETLAELIRDGARLSLSRRLKLLEELCDGLAYAHRAGLVHRDVKPANLMVDADGVLKILDFGIVRVTDSGMTQAGVLVGTVNYMSPEQVVGETVDHRSDIFAVGLVAYELLTGKQAFAGTIKDGLLNRILTVAIEPLPAVVPTMDPEVVSIVDLALKKDPAERYQDLARLRNDLARARQRIERAEEEAAAEASASAGETVVIGQEITIDSRVPQVRSSPSLPAALVHDAERALADGNFRIALTLAGRSAAINPSDRVATGIAARAEAALLDRGRLLESGAPLEKPGAPAPTGSSTASGQSGGRAMWVAVAIAVVALAVAVVALWSRDRRSGRDVALPTASAPTVSTPPSVPPSPTKPATDSASPPVSANAAPAESRPPSSQDTSSPPAASRETDTASPGREVRRPSGDTAGRRTEAGRNPRNAEIGRGGRQQAEPKSTPPPPAPSTSERPLPAPPTAPEPTVERPAAPPPERTTTEPEPVKPPATPSVEARPNLPSASPKSPEPPRGNAGPAPDPRDEIRHVLARYEAAWEALDVGALQRVWSLSATQVGEMTSSMRDTASVSLDLTVSDINVEPSGKTAVVHGTEARVFRPKVGVSQTLRRRVTIRLERRDAGWVIVSIA
jgi:hypothetical protein